MARRTDARSGERRLVVLNSSFEEIGHLITPPRGKRWRPAWVVKPTGVDALTGQSGTIPAWILFALLSPLWLVANLIWMLGGTGDRAWSLPSRTAWKSDRWLRFLPAPFKYYGFSKSYKIRPEKLDPRLGYALSVVHRDTIRRT